jgi:hypothetical protein
MRYSGHVARMGDVRNALKCLIEKPEDKSLLGRPIRRWDDDIEMELQGICCADVDWIHQAQNVVH